MIRHTRGIEYAERATRGVTCDTGMLIGLERNKGRARALLRALRLARVHVTIPAPVLAEWWRGTHASLLAIGTLEPLTPALARQAGELLARSGGANTIDALVIVSAAQRGDRVITSDPDDLTALAKLVTGVDVDTL